MIKRALLLLAVLGTTVLAGCGSDDGSTASASASASASGSTASGECEVVDGTDAERDAEVHVTLDEWAIDADTDSVEAGNIEFDAKNIGEDDHELVIVKGALPKDLTITDDGLDEDALPEGAEVLGEIEGFPGGDSCHGTFELAAGDYTLLCNIVEASEHEAHAHEGMVTAFRVS